MKWAAGAAFPPAAIASRETSMHQYLSSSIVDLGWCRMFPTFPPKSKTFFPFQFGLRSCASKYANCPSLLVMNDIALFLRGAWFDFLSALTLRSCVSAVNLSHERLTAEAAKAAQRKAKTLP